MKECSLAGSGYIKHPSRNGGAHACRAGATQAGMTERAEEKMVREGKGESFVNTTAHIGDKSKGGDSVVILLHLDRQEEELQTRF